MHFNLRHLAAAAALAAASSSALAVEAFPTPISLGTLGTSAAAVFAQAFSFNGAPTYSFSFTLDSSTGFSDLAGALRFADPVDLTINLAGASFSGTTTVAGSPYIPNVFSFSSLADGNYVISFTGLSTSSAGSFGGGFVQATPVPEPESMALVLAGLGVAGTLLRRRKTV
ncbi:PEP-CTERM sorting domain-containing protein [Aquabacterium soli]|jgi:hypothetical protein|uniref:PEP-CTERM sorting domain-containing protein n=1 Tax=Aquabacterium soli TaxID=2493092 RepID=A0A426V638_9BURK|nr:FxDxF family PEP-CTERM protein [Aquabacterium soli]RRS02280.1 PEP-CTERM sorting domain-containing protein [Aquabacterium soli]